jgi:hypothetical protein
MISFGKTEVIFIISFFVLIIIFLLIFIFTAKAINNAIPIPMKYTTVILILGILFDLLFVQIIIPTITPIFLSFLGEYITNNR